jgi:hypothetical protein
MSLKLLRTVHMGAQDPLDDIGLSVLLGCMLAPKDLCIIVVIHKIIFSITSTYITSVRRSNVGFLAGTVSLEVVNTMAIVILNV